MQKCAMLFNCCLGSKAQCHKLLNKLEFLGFELKVHVVLHYSRRAAHPPVD